MTNIEDVIQYDPDTGSFEWKDRKKKYAKVGNTNARGYTVIKVNGKTYRAGRLAWYLTYGKWPDNCRNSYLESTR